MEMNCPRCGAKNESDEESTAGAQGSVCAVCGASLGGVSDISDGGVSEASDDGVNDASVRGVSSGGVSEAAPNVRRAREYDGYAVGRRILNIAPVWLLLTIAGFVVVWLLFSWVWLPVGRRGAQGGEDFKNEAMNRAPAPDAQTSGIESKTRASATPASGPVVTESATPAVSREPASSPETVAQGAAGVSEADAYSVQVGAFAELSQANEQVSRMRAAGFDARVVESEATTRFHFQVRSGRFEMREEAVRLAAQLRAKGVAGQTIIVEPVRGF
jgi:cell division septation protein DedD